MASLANSYFVRTPSWLMRLFPNIVWKMPQDEHSVYLTFDDGPNPKTTEWILKTLNDYQTKATFFCLGQQVSKNKDLYYNLINNSHSIGNHGFKHINGWKKSKIEYKKNCDLADKVIDSNLFRPPYGKMKLGQIKSIQRTHKIIMWSILSGDFDSKISAKQCLENCIKNTEAGSIVTFHDNDQSFEKLKIVLPQYLTYLRDQNFQTKVIPNTYDR